MVEEHACDEETEQKQDDLIEVRHDVQDKIPSRRFDTLPFDPVTRDENDGML